MVATNIFVSSDRMFRYPPLFLLVTLLNLVAIPASWAKDDGLLSEVVALEQTGSYREALEILASIKDQYPNNEAVFEAELRLLLLSSRLGDASNLTNELPIEHSLKQSANTAVEQALSRVVRNDKLATIYIQKRIELKDFSSAILVADRALLQFPDRHGDLFTLKGEALYKQNNLEAAEKEFMRALQIDPLNPVAKSYVNEIRTTLAAQTSTALAEWISIAKDKTGDFVVTFLALFTAFLMNSLLSPLSMRYRLARARKSFDEGNYDDFADAVERLLDQEDFKPLRQNFRLLMRKRPYEEIKSIFETHVMTEGRLPTLLRILKREHERLEAGE